MEVAIITSSKEMEVYTFDGLNAGPPVEVGVTMFIISISSVSEVQMVC